MAGETRSGTPRKAWVAVLLMVVGFSLCVLALPWRDARLPLLITGVVLGLAGIVLAKISNLMDFTE